MKLIFKTMNSHEELLYSVNEFKYFLNTYSTAVITTEEAAADAVINLGIDETMDAHCYSIDGNGKVLNISGGKASSVYYGVCEVLADAGIIFEATGHFITGRFDLEKLLNCKKTVRPKCRLRGIRQHINFTMDISSYPLNEAKEYIRSLARMRYNAIVFHSYGGQWHITKPGEAGEYAGHFFYGQDHPVPACDKYLADKFINQKYYCIPEVEPIYENEAARSEYAQYWLKEVMNTAKMAGMNITLSVELPFDDETRICAMLKEVCQVYSMIDQIELLSFENFGENGEEECKGLTHENMLEVFTELLGKDILEADGTLHGMEETYTSLQYGNLKGGAIYLKRILTALKNKEKWLGGLSRQPEIRAGLYMTNKDVLKVLVPLMKKVLPQEMKKCLLSAHGSLAVTESIAYSGVEENDWQNVMYYSWAEFDGNMFLQQNSADGIEKLLDMSEAENIYGFCINHWRTSENNMTISYAAEAAITPLSTKEFYKLYAEKLNILHTEKFIAVFDRLAKLDVYCRDELFNIGFCHIGCWLNWHRKDGITRTRGYSMEAQDYAICEYEAIASEFEALISEVNGKEARSVLGLMANRCRTSVLHIRAMQVLEELNQFVDFENIHSMSEEQRQRAIKIVEKSQKYAEDYVALYGEWIPDRGSLGLIASFCETAPVYIKAVMANFAGEAEDSTGLKIEYDAPPMPNTESK